MTAKTIFIWLRAVSLIVPVALSLTSARASDHETVLYSFGPLPDGNSFSGNLITDSAHNLYGATSGGGSGTYCVGGCGTIFELSPGPHGAWTETVLHNFNGNDGIEPFAGVIMDAAGNLYGTTYQGGTHGGGTVFELTPSPDGGWTETVLYNFGTGTLGGFPLGGLIMDGAGNLYGTTSEGGTYNQGAVFELSPNSGGGWTGTVLHNFGNGNDGIAPIGSLIMDAAGNLYGATFNGGQNRDGTVFEVSPGAGGWTESILHSFDGNDGYGPSNGLVMDAAGNLYGTAYQGGNLVVCAPFGCGTVFEVSPVVGGGWTETTLYNFNGQPDAGYPLSTLILDGARNLYGTTSVGGNDNSGAVFKLSPRQDGWTETVLYSFNRDGSGGDYPGSGVIMDRAGNLFGVTSFGGINDSGVAYELISPSICAARCVPGS